VTCAREGEPDTTGRRTCGTETSPEEVVVGEQHRRPRGDAHWRRRGLPSVEIADALRARVERGELVPGQRIPRLRDLAAEHHVSVGTVVRALGMLTHDGTVVKGPANGTFVAHRNPQRM
jgi:DNA-binding GntR family transcriptional regulator